ncbi:GNAT family N-acetyltransferase [Pseudoneobacillus rhizosphaerae]|uniref:N-acetyltransferase YvbK n=1 Tax=Pseudoneobacillus rhizosphaerae TaxID=2880968 RepID=A0A9C7GAP9_9BACI|nr:GNAT family N-acetyltransferase [Pseudoneobacillus rhizosphaerae]CAG9609111.1 putative N-acetyltransferase YvbK [Pseudoneobacillus rhizosphaerae]
MKIRELNVNEEPPINLMLLADPSQKLIEEYLNRGVCYVGEKNNEITGVYVLLPTRPGTVEIVNIAVSENEQGKGIGKQLLMDAIQRSKAGGFITIEIGTGNSSIGQLALYQKCGFRITNVDRDFFIRHYEEKIFENGIWCRDMIRLSQDLNN